MNITGTITLSGQIIAPPSLSGLSAAANGATGWVGSVTTDTDNGTLFYLISSSWPIEGSQCDRRHSLVGWRAFGRDHLLFACSASGFFGQ